MKNRLIFPKNTEGAIIKKGDQTFLGYFYKENIGFTRRLNIKGFINENTCLNCKFALDFDNKIIEVLEKVSHQVIDEIFLFIDNIMIDNLYIKYSILFNQNEYFEYKGNCYIIFNYNNCTYITSIKEINLKEINFFFSINIKCCNLNTLLCIEEPISTNNYYYRGKEFIMELLGYIDKCRKCLYNLVTYKGYNSINEYRLAQKFSNTLNVFNIGDFINLRQSYTYKGIKRFICIGNGNVFPDINKFNARYIPSVIILLEKITEYLNKANIQIENIYRDQYGCKLFDRSIFNDECLLKNIPNKFKHKYIRSRDDSIFLENFNKSGNLYTYINLLDMGPFINISKSYHKQDNIYVFKRVNSNKVWEIHNCFLGNTYRDGSICWGNIPRNTINDLNEKDNSLIKLFELYLVSIFNMDISTYYIYMGNDTYIDTKLIKKKGINSLNSILMKNDFNNCSISMIVNPNIIGLSFNDDDEHIEFIYK